MDGLVVIKTARNIRNCLR